MSVFKDRRIRVVDGLATGYTARAGIEQVRRRGAGRVVLAVPVAPEDSVATMGRVADEFVLLQTPTWFFSIGEPYEASGRPRTTKWWRCFSRAAKQAAGEATQVTGRA